MGLAFRLISATRKTRNYLMRVLQRQTRSPVSVPLPHSAP